MLVWCSLLFCTSAPNCNNDGDGVMVLVVVDVQRSRSVEVARLLLFCLRALCLAGGRSCSGSGVLGPRVCGSVSRVRGSQSRPFLHGAAQRAYRLGFACLGLGIGAEDVYAELCSVSKRQRPSAIAKPGFNASSFWGSPPGTTSPGRKLQTFSKKDLH